MKKINKKLLLSTSLLMPILPIFATISCNNKKTNDSTEQQFDLTKLETGFYNIPADYFSNNGIQLAGGFYFVLNDPNETTKMESDLGTYYKAILNNVPKPPTEDFIINNNDKISKPNQVAILDRETITLESVDKTNFQEKKLNNIVEISVTPNSSKTDASQRTTYELKTVELKNEITLTYTAKADLYNVSTSDKATATLTPAGSGKINLSATKKIVENEQLNKYDKVTILVKKSTTQTQ
ncbi:MAG: hypothetical protein IKL15_00365 [Mycoplasmataceae bacterium]|nr:hypothetical protein [Mycoplasmataceae bacterium]